MVLVLAGTIDVEVAGRYFEDARVLAERDGGRLWGVSLDGR
jgi:hypothetical protein